MRVLIPAGGRGVRLRPLTLGTPKPLLPVAGVPILARILDEVPPDFDVTLSVTADLHPRFLEWAEASGRACDVYAERPREAGLAGPVVALSDCVRDRAILDDFLILMGDSLQPFPLDEFLNGWDAKTARIAVYEVARPEDARRFGVVEMDEDGRVISFEEKPAAPRSRWVFTGCGIFPGRLLPVLHEAAADGLTQMGDLVRRCLERGEVIEAFPAAGEWHDVGTIDSYFAAHGRFCTKSMARRLFETDNECEGMVWVHPQAYVASSQLADTLIGENAFVRDCNLTGCVIGAGVRIERRSAANAYITTEAELPLRGGE